MLGRAGFSAAVIVAALLASSSASADEPAPAPAPPPPAAPADNEDWRQRNRVHPSDDGQEHRADPQNVRPVETEPSTVATDVALAVPRIILAPPRVVLETAYLPIRGLLYLMGRYQIPERIVEFLYNDDRTAAIIPSISFIGGQGFTAGVHMFHEGWGRHKERIDFSAKFGGRFVQAYELEMSAPNVAGTPFGIEVTTRFEIQPHLRFWGYGPQEAQEFEGAPPQGPRDAHVETRFRQQRGMVRARMGWSFTDEINLGVIGVLNRRDFGPKETEDDPEPSIERVYDTSQIPGFNFGYTLVEPLLDFRIDSRFPAGTTSEGIYFNAFGGGAPPQNGFRFIHYGAEIAGFINLFNEDRILVLHAAHESVLGSDDEIPFADMPRLGGPTRLRGFDLHRFRDNHTAVVTVQYEWPIHEFVSGVGFFELGSVGEDYEELVQPDNYRPSGGGGLIFRDRHTKFFTVQMAYGDSFQVFLTSDPLVAFDKRGGEEL
ncbi:MAG: hypothetical protein HOW73_34085 [Polyangiaceae bacterium]|nr:hypothetical protein [Polyangiaceae bacterium]